MRPRILVLGCTGMLGSTVFRHLLENGYDAYGTCRPRTRELASELFPPERLVAFYHPGPYTIRMDYDYYFNALGVIKPLVTKVGRLELVLVNSAFPHQLAEDASILGQRVIHVSTDCVFSGRELEQLTESTPTDATDDYGKSKVLGEPTDKAMVIRTSIIGREIKGKYSFVEWAISRQGKTVNGYSDNHWNGITTRQYGRVLGEIIEKNLWQTGLFHIHSPQVIRKSDLLEEVSNHLGLGLTINKGPGPEPSFRALSTEKTLVKQLNILPIQEQIRADL